jgi:probable F420-dependent oxidoreductase
VSGRIELSVQGQLRSPAGWLACARSAEDAGCDALYVADHPGTSAAPFVALAAAAAVTERIRLGTCVANAGLWEPLSLANEVATLDAVSDGRAILGLGAGHTPDEWTMSGRAIPAPAQRVERLVEVTRAVQRLLRGEVVSSRAGAVRLERAQLSDPRPIQDAIPLLVGGNGPRVLRFAAQIADIVSVGGLGRTLADGHTHEALWSKANLDKTFDAVRVAAARAGRTPVVEALVQHIEVTDDAMAAAARIAPHVAGASPADLIDAPFIWIGTRKDIAQQLSEAHERWGISRYVVRDGVLRVAREVMQELRS